MYWSKVVGACIVLALALVYLIGFTKSGLVGFVLVGVVGGSIGYRIKKGSLPAVCDLCGSKGFFSAEYGAGFSNARLILTCEKCGRVVNKVPYGIRPEKE